MAGKVYILVNLDIKCVKVGMTVNNPEERLIEINRMWRGKNVTCQVCGGKRLINRKGVIPKHVVSGAPCPGGQFLPLEKDTKLAKSYLDMLKEKYESLSGSGKGSSTRKIKSLESRIKKYESSGRKPGRWRLDTVYVTPSAEDVELKSHKVLDECLDKNMPFGEVFNCSVEKARETIESVIDQLGFSEAAKKIIYES